MISPEGLVSRKFPIRRKNFPKTFWWRMTGEGDMKSSPWTSWKYGGPSGIAKYSAADIRRWVVGRGMAR